MAAVVKGIIWLLNKSLTACQKLAEKVANGDYMTPGHYNHYKYRPVLNLDQVT